MDTNKLPYSTAGKSGFHICWPGLASLACLFIGFCIWGIGAAVRVANVDAVGMLWLLVFGIGFVLGVIGILTSRARSPTAWIGVIFNSGLFIAVSWLVFFFKT